MHRNVTPQSTTNILSAVGRALVGSPMVGKTTLGESESATPPAAEAPARDRHDTLPWEQEAPGEAIVATGVRASFWSARNIRRDAYQVVVPNVPEDVGKLPYQDVPEALQPSTGKQISRLQVERLGVEARQPTELRTEPSVRTSCTGVRLQFCL